MGPCPLDAFHFTTALTLGLEALPLGHRPATHAALPPAGLSGTDLWGYLHRTLPAPELPRRDRFAAESATPGVCRLLVTEDGSALADATIGTPVQGSGVHGGSESTQAHAGEDSAVLSSAPGLDTLSRMGATDAIPCVDDDAPPGDDRDRTAVRHAVWCRCGR